MELSGPLFRQCLKVEAMAKYNAYSKEVIDFIRENAFGKTAEELSVLVNEKFGTNFDKNKIKSFKQNHKICSGKEHLKKRKTETALFPKEIIEFIMANYKGTGPSEMAAKLNEKFGTEYSVQQIRAFYGNRKLDSGITGYFEPGHVSPNKGKKGFHFEGCEKGWFGSGHVPFNKMPVGTVVKKSDGYLWRKTGESSRAWKQEHIIRWEEKNGTIPKGFCLTFLDGNKENIELSNLALVSRAEHVNLTRMKLRSENPEITKTGILISRLYTEKQKRKKGKNNGRRTQSGSF